MKREMKGTMRRALTLLLVPMVFLAAGAAAFAQESPSTAPAAVAPAGPAPAKAVSLGEGRGQVILTWDEFVKITGYDPSKKGTQVLTVPWTEVESLLGVKVPDMAGKGATVDLPWNEFKALLEWSIKKKEEKQETPPPTDYIITSSRYKGDLTSEAATFALDLKINVLRLKGWKRIPVLPLSVALTETKLPDGVFLNSSQNAYELLTEKSGEVAATLTFSVSVQKSAGINQVGFDRVAVGSSVVDLTVDNEKNPKMDVKVAGSQSLVSKAADGKTNVAAAIPSGTPISISWERAIEKVAAAPTKLYADTETLVAVAEGVLLCQETVNFNILHTAVRELKLTVPKGVSVLEVTGNNVTDWRVDDKGELLVVFRAEVIGPTALRIAYEQASKDAASVEIPVIRATGVEREKGFIGVIALANVEITAGKVDGATSVDVKQLSGDIVAMTKQPILLAFRYVGEKFSIPLAVKKHAEVTVLLTIVDSGLFTGMQLNDGRRMTKVIYSVRNNRSQFLRLKMPEADKAGGSVEIWSASVGGNTVSPAKDEKGSVLIPLIRSSAGGQDLASFPVEIVYVETPAKTAPASGKVHVDLPALVDVPTMHVMYNYYLPAEGEYTLPEGLFGRKSGFSGPIRLVGEFASMTTDRGTEVLRRDAAKQVQQMQQQIDVRVDTEAKAAGATPIRVRLPIDGKLFKLEKILALPEDKLYFEVQYSGWQVAK